MTTMRISVTSPPPMKMPEARSMFVRYPRSASPKPHRWRFAGDTARDDRGSPVVGPAADLVSGAAEHHEDEADDDDDDAGRPQEADTGDGTEEEEKESSDDHALRVPARSALQTCRQTSSFGTGCDGEHVESGVLDPSALEGANHDHHRWTASGAQ
jgi:hypothetical protein